MSKHYTAEEAKALLDGITPPPWGRLSESSSVVGIKIEMWDYDDMERANVRIASAAPGLAATVIAQAEQIARLQAEVVSLRDRYRSASRAHRASHNWAAADVWEAAADGINGLTAADMEEQ